MNEPMAVDVAEEEIIYICEQGAIYYKVCAPILLKRIAVSSPRQTRCALLDRP